MKRQLPLTGRLSRDRAMTIGFVAVAFALALGQRPGWATSDTKIDLHVDPVRFLSQVASVWTPTTDLGEVHSAQYSGYLWPMGPFFAVLHSIGIGPWLTQRLWLGLLFALSVWGILKLLDALIGRPRGVAHGVATAFFLLNPYVAVFTARTTITLLGYAALPWLLLIVHRGLRSRDGWRGLRGWAWAAAFALVLTSIGGGVNAAVVAWMLVGPLVLLVYEPAIGAVRWRDSLRFLARAGALGVLVSLWWIAPLLVHVRYGIDFLQFTEQPASIWATNSITESLRLMGYWTSYIGVGFGVNRPFFSDGSTFLFNPLVVGASLLLPAIAVAGFARARRLTYAPLLLALVVVGVVIMMAGFPDGTPLRGAMLWVYQHVFVLRFARTTNKAAPLVAVGLAGLLGISAQQLIGRARGLGRPALRRTAAAAVGITLLGLIGLAALPLIRGGAIDTQLEFKRIPSAWRQAGRGLDRTLPANTRALVLPGQIFAYYNWGGTLDAILPRLTSRPVAVRYETPYSDLHAVDLLTTVDDLVQQRRLVPGELSPLLRLMGVGAVVTGADDDISRSGAIDPAAAAGVLSAQLGSAASARYGPPRRLPPAAGDVGTPVGLPQVRRYDTSAGRGIVHVDPAGPATIIDGTAHGLADLGAFGGLPAQSPIFYSADLSRRAVRSQAAGGANVVVTDSNRRREYLPQSTQQNLGATLTAGEPLPVNAAVINPLAPAGTNAQTVAVLQGARYIKAPTQAGELQFPEHAPIAAFDGQLSTTWLADRYLPDTNRWIEIGLPAPRDVPYVDVYPLSGTHGIVKQVDVNGIRHPVGLGWTRIEVNLHHVTAIRVTLDKVRQPSNTLGGPGGFREIRIPGVHVREVLRTPVITAQALTGTDLRHDSLTYVFERTTGDDPFRRNPASASTTILNNAQARGDAEAFIDRYLFAPAPRAYSASAWVYPALDAPDSALDRLVGLRGAARFDSSGRFQNQPAFRASSAFDGRVAPGWIGIWKPGQTPAPWISWSGPRRLTVVRLRITPAALAVRRPTQVRLSWGTGRTAPLTVAADGTVALPAPVRARSFRLTILSSAFPAGASARQRQATAVGIGSLQVPGLNLATVPRGGALARDCGIVAIQVGARSVPLELAGTIGQLDAGQAVPARSCGGPVPMGAGLQEIHARPGVFSVDLLQLRSPAPAASAPAPGGATVLNPGRIGQSSVNGVRVALRAPAWLVLGESFDTGWRATCDGRSLGVPLPIDGFANGWLGPAGCRQVEFSFAPQGVVRLSYFLSAGAALALLVLLLAAGLVRRRHPIADRPPRVLLPEARRGGRQLAWAAAQALIIAVPVGWIFAWRAGVTAFPLLTVLLWRGIGPVALTWTAVGLLGAVVPIVYAIISPRDTGGYDFGYSTSLIDVHWIGVAGVLLLALAGGQMIAASRVGRRAPPSGGPPRHDADQDPVGAVEQEVIRG